VNHKLTIARAEFAAERLRAFGVPQRRLVVVGRPGEQYLTSEVGEGSDSRRVQFEVVAGG
jgi:outer membrane protein OmpA-like peptidoglycan-associated protein